MKRSRSLGRKFINGAEGIFITIRSERNMKIHLLAALLAVFCGVYLELALWKWVALFLTIALVLVAEIFNTAIEIVVDLNSKTYHPLAKKAKDTSAGAVLMAALWAVIIGVLIFIF